MADVNGTKRAKVLDKDSNETSTTIKFLDRGETLTISFDELSDEIKTALIGHGLEQKLGDAAAGKSGDEAYEAVMSVAERLRAGDWTKGREGAGPRPTLIVEAVLRYLESKGQTIDETARAKAMAKYAGKGTEEARKAALANSGVKRAFEQLKIERMQANLAKLGVDASPQSDAGLI